MRSEEGVKGRCLPWSKEEEGGIYFLNETSACGFNPAETVVEKSVILLRIKMSHAFPRMLSNRLLIGKSVNNEFSGVKTP